MCVRGRDKGEGADQSLKNQFSKLVVIVVQYLKQTVKRVLSGAEFLNIVSRA